MGFCTFQKTSILTPLKLSFSLVFFITVTGAETRPDLEAYAIPPTPCTAVVIVTANSSGHQFLSFAQLVESVTMQL